MHRSGALAVIVAGLLCGGPAGGQVSGDALKLGVSVDLSSLDGDKGSFLPRPWRSQRLAARRSTRLSSSAAITKSPRSAPPGNASASRKRLVNG
jgi:hypothetical protein